jgi:hypothetical protein|tara:strand:+ start:772 stop:1053 length:282 start_codon:yes stop_codon:yes gene_type:complete
LVKLKKALKLLCGLKKKLMFLNINLEKTRKIALVGCVIVSVLVVKSFFKVVKAKAFGTRLFFLHLTKSKKLVQEVNLFLLKVFEELKIWNIKE